MRKEHWIAVSLVILALSLGAAAIASAGQAASGRPAAPMCRTAPENAETADILKKDKLK